VNRKVVENKKTRSDVLDFGSTTNRNVAFSKISQISRKVWSEVSNLEPPKDQKLTLKFKASSNDPAKTVFIRKQAQVKNHCAWF